MSTSKHIDSASYNHEVHLAVTEPSILDAVVDQDGEHWVRYGTMTRSSWFTLRELVCDEKAVFGRLAGAGCGWGWPTKVRSPGRGGGAFSAGAGRAAIAGLAASAVGGGSEACGWPASACASAIAAMRATSSCLAEAS